jgi:hypothetical protein
MRRQDQKNMHRIRQALEGEVAAKIRVPARQLYAYQWVERRGLTYRLEPAEFNPSFAPPSPLSDIRAAL